MQSFQTHIFPTNYSAHCRLSDETSRKAEGWREGQVRVKRGMLWWVLCLKDSVSSALELTGTEILTCSSWSCRADSACLSWRGEPQSRREAWAGRRRGWADVHPNISGSEAWKRTKPQTWMSKVTKTRLNTGFHNCGKLSSHLRTNRNSYLV